MATKKTPLDDDFSMPAPGNDADLEQAIDDLRGVLKTDAQGLVPEISDFGTDFGGGNDAFGGDFGAAEPDVFANPGATAGASAFGGGGFGSASTARAESPRMQEPGSALNSNLDLIMDIPIDVQIVLGSSRMQVSSLMNLTEGATISLDRKIGEPVDLIVNGRLIGRVEITVLEHDETRFGIKLIEVMAVRKS